jgi:L-rhamnonate dehydratase
VATSSRSLPSLLLSLTIDCRFLDIANSPDGLSIAPVFGNLFLNEPVPHGGCIDVSDEPGFGLILNPEAKLIPSSEFLAPNPDNGLSMTDEEEALREKRLMNGVNGKH